MPVGETWLTVGRPDVQVWPRKKDEMDAVDTKLEPENGLKETSSESVEDLGEKLLPDDVAAEENRLHDERERHLKEEREKGVKQMQSRLPQARFKQLDLLLDQTKLYSQFLEEQMHMIEKKTEVEGEEEADGNKKRKASPRRGSTKKSKTSEHDELVRATKDLVPLIEGELRDYQLKGIKWMISLYQNGINGILADQMGLGKTVQTIGFLSHLRSKGVLGPFLIIAPLSTLPNWIAEVERWCPSMPVLLYHGTKEERAHIRRKCLPTGPVNEKFPVIVTSYEIIIADRKFLQKYLFKYLVVDEGHRLKNYDCKLLRELRQLHCANKLLLTGTPLQNSLPELWSLLNFILPDVFSSLSNFESWFDFSALQEGKTEEVVAAEQRDKVISKLHSILRPFLLRRVKADVEVTLPRKQEIILYAQMTPLQKQLNEKLRDKTLLQTLQEKYVKEGGTGVGQLSKLNNMLMQMRKTCNHPDLVTGDYDNEPDFPSAKKLKKDCGKLRLLDRLLLKLHEKGHKVLIFSQMTKMLDILEYYLEEMGHNPCRIDGSVCYQDRQAQMKSFNNDPDVFCFLLSTRAGGLGINLTGADTVIIYDSDWNPHQDLQAMDRAHRIGQTKPVLVFRLATANSVEGRMLKRANEKLVLDKIVMKNGAFLQEESSKKSSLSAEELLGMLANQQDSGDLAQKGEVDDGVLELILDRNRLERDPELSKKAKPLPTLGVGYTVLEEQKGEGLLSGVE